MQEDQLHQVHVQLVLLVALMVERHNEVEHMMNGKHHVKLQH
jgi:hypothetical protein